MKKISISSEDKMILEFLRGELNSTRFNKKLGKILKKLNISTDIITDGNIDCVEENETRKLLMKKYREYPTRGLFQDFPEIFRWDYVQFEKNDINNIFYINYDYWNELSNRTSKPTEAAKVIQSGIEIYDVSNNSYLSGVEYLKNNSFSPIILITCSAKKFLIIEGHYRMTVYGLNPNKFNNTFGYVGYCSEEDMKKYDIRMI